MSDNTGNGFCSSSGPAVATVEVPEDDEAGIGVTTVERPEACMFSPEFTPLNALRLIKDCLAYFNKHATRNKGDNGSIFVNAKEDPPQVWIMFKDTTEEEALERGPLKCPLLNSVTKCKQ